MRHVYLTKVAIDKAYREGGITKGEVHELLLKLELCDVLAQAKTKVH